MSRRVESFRLSFFFFFSSGFHRKLSLPAPVWLGAAGQVTLLLLLFGGLGACAAVPALDRGVSWKEEVVNHDGRRFIVERTQTFDRDGLREIGRDDPLRKQTLRFERPNGHQVTWEADFGRGYQDNLEPLVLGIVEGVPYLITHTTRCHAYNKWDRPNPPYVYFRYVDGDWQRISIDSVPHILNQTNLSLSGSLSRAERLARQMGTRGYVSARQIREQQSHMTSESAYLRQIVWESLTSGPVSCAKLVFYHGAWVSPGDSIGKRMIDRMIKSGHWKTKKP
jgi:hypothetical protein